MERLTIFALCSLAAFTMAVPWIDAQTNGSVAQNNGGGVAVNGNSPANSGHPNAAVSHGIARGPVTFAPRMINSHPARIGGQPGMNPRTNYSPFLRPPNPTLAAMSARQSERIYNLHPNIDVLARREIPPGSPPLASPQPVARAADFHTVPYA